MADIISDEEAWLQELNLMGKRSNVIAGLAAFFLVPMHIFTTDYIDEHERFSTLSITLRLAMAVSTLLIVLLQNKIKLRSEYFSYATFFIISIGDGYMSSRAQMGALQTHLLGYSIVLIGSNMTFFWKVKHSIISIILSISIVTFLFYLNSDAPPMEIAKNGGFFTLFIVVLSIILMGTRYMLYKRNFMINLSLVKSKEIIEENKKALEVQNKQLEDKNKNITSSINYARRIQQAILPEADIITKAIPQYFIFYRPKDIVSGDFYWFNKSDEDIFIASVDCTGHGVPGAFMSLIGYSQLNKIIIENGEKEPGKILTLLNKEVIKALKQDVAASESRDGMDIALLRICLENGEVSYAGANRPLYFIKNNVFEEIKGTSLPIGGSHSDRKERVYKNHILSLNKGDMAYLSSDGFADQVGGPERRKYMSKRFKNLLVEIQNLEVYQQKDYIIKEFDQWKEKEKQIDDVLVIGIKI